ncbi:MAG: ABC transporter substrate-binding protein [bacterium]
MLKNSLITTFIEKTINQKILNFRVNFFIFLLLVVFIFWGCGTSKQGSEKIIFWTSSLKPYFTEYIESVIKNFEELYGVKVQWQDYPLDAIYQKILTNYGTELSPDVVNVNPLLAAGLYKKKVISILYEDEFKNYHSNLIEGCKIDGKLITIPWYSSTKMIVYNKEIFDFSSLKINDYKGFFSLVKSIKEEKGVYGFYPFLKFEQDMLGLGLISDPYDPFNDDTMQFFKILRDYKDYLPSGFWVSSVEVAYSMYKDRKVASILIGPQFLYRIKKEDPKLYENTDVLPFPFKNYPVTVMSLSVLDNKDKERYDKAIKFIKFLTNFENQNKFFKMVPVVPSVSGNYNFKDDDKLMEKVKIQMLKIFPNSRVFDLYFYDVIPDPTLRSSIFKNFLNDVFNSDISLDEVKKKYTKIWKENQVKNN